MANIRKSFNFRSGLQVDNDNFYVNPNGLVGIGTSIPTEAIDARGNAKISGLTTTSTLGVGETATFFGDLKVGSINIDPTSGVVTATKFVGDASGLTGIFAISTTGFVAQGVGLHTISRSIGIGTTNPVYKLQIGLDPATGVGIGMTAGNIRASGVITATTFVGALTGSVNGNVTGVTAGVASTATKLEIARDFSIIGDVSASAISFDGTGDVALSAALSNSFSANTTGIITASKFVGPTESTTSTITTGTITQANITNADVGIGTFDDLRIDNAAGASLVVTSTTNSSVSIGESVGAGNSSVQLLYTPGTGRLDINNYDVGGVSINLHEGTGAGTTQGFNIKYDNTKQFEVTYDGKVGVNRGGASLTRNFEVGGDALVSRNATVTGILTVTGTGGNTVTLGDGSALPMPDSQNFNTVSGISTFNNLRIANNLSVGASITSGTMAYFGGEVGIGTTNNNGFKTAITNLKAHVEGSTWSKNGVLTAGRLAITNKSDGSLYTDDRLIPSGNGALGPGDTTNYGSVVPFVDYGDFQVTTGGAGLIVSSVLMVPDAGTATVGFGTTNGGLIPQSFLPGGNRYLTSVGVNTYYARSIFDVGTGSTTMNSYFIPPSLTQSEIDLVSNLWNTPGALGHNDANKVTPDGLVPGALIYNKTTDTIQVRDTANSFRDLSSSLLSTEQTTTSGTEFEFADVPAWAKKITVMFSGVTLSGNNHFKIQLGTSSTYVQSNYTSTSSNEPGNAYVSSSDSIVIRSGSPIAFYGQTHITKFSSSAYVWNGSFGVGSNNGAVAHGSVTGISGAITKLKIFASGSNTFSAGQINVLYEG